MAPGSHLVISLGSPDGADAEMLAEATPDYAGARMLFTLRSRVQIMESRESDPGVGSRRQGRRFYRRTLLARAQARSPVELPEQPEANWQRISHVSHDHRVRAAHEPSGAVQCDGGPYPSWAIRQSADDIWPCTAAIPPVIL